MAESSMLLRVEPSPELVALLSALSEAAARLHQIGQPALDLCQPVLEAFGLDGNDLLTTRACDGLVLCDPTDRLRDLLAALRAIEGQFFGVEHRHDGLLHGAGGTAPMVTAPGRGRNDPAPEGA